MILSHLILAASQATLHRLAPGRGLVVEMHPVKKIVQFISSRDA